MSARTLLGGAHRGDGEAHACECGLDSVARFGAVQPHGDLAHEVGVGRVQAVDALERLRDLRDAARAVDALDLVHLGNRRHSVSVPGATGAPGTLTEWRRLPR